MKTRLLFVPLVLALVASLAACGGGSPSVPANAVAEVGNTPITIADFNGFFNQAAAVAVANGQPKPSPGTPAYTSTRDEVVAYLVQVTELEQQASKEHVSMTQGEVSTFLTNLAKTNYGGSMAKLTAALKKQGLSMATAREEVFVNLLANKIKAKVTATAKPPTMAQERAYYNTNIAQYQTAASTTRNIEYILFKCAATGTTTCPAAKSRAEKTKADNVEQKLKNGASFEAMAKQYSDDSSSASNGGHLCIAKSGQSGSCIPTVPAFSNVGFALKTGKISQPVDATSTANQGFGWFIIKALAPVQNVKAHTTPFSQEEPTIKQSLLQQAQDALWKQWIADLQKQYQGKVSYGGGYAPPTTTALPTTNAPVTTG